MIGLIVAAAVSANAAPKAMLGRWGFGQDGEGAPACVVTLAPERVIGGFKLIAPKGCARVSDRAEDLYAWYLNTEGSMVFADVTRQPVIVFSHHDQGAFSTAIGAPTAYLLTRGVGR